MKTGNLNIQGLNAYYRQTFGYGHKRTSSDDQMKRYSSQSGNSPILEQIHLMNGVVLEPKLLFEGKAYSLVSINNGLRLPIKKKAGKSQGYFDISKLFGVKYADDGSEILNKKENKKHENYENSLDDENSEANLEDLNAFLQDQEINPFDPDEDAQERKHFNKRISKLLQERYMPTGEGTPRSSHYLKSKCYS